MGPRAAGAAAAARSHLPAWSFPRFPVGSGGPPRRPPPVLAPSPGWGGRRLVAVAVGTGAGAPLGQEKVQVSGGRAGRSRFPGVCEATRDRECLETPSRRPVLQPQTHAEPLRPPGVSHCLPIPAPQFLPVIPAIVQDCATQWSSWKSHPVLLDQKAGGPRPCGDGPKGHQGKRPRTSRVTVISGTSYVLISVSTGFGGSLKTLFYFKILFNSLIFRERDEGGERERRK